MMMTQGKAKDKEGVMKIREEKSRVGNDELLRGKR